MEGFPKNSTQESIRSVQNVEAQIEKILDSLPEDIADRWDIENSSLSAEEKLVSLQNFIDKRNRALHSYLESNNDPERIDIVRTSPLAVMRMLSKLEGGVHEELGLGHAGRVIASVRHPNICYKVMFPLDLLPEGTNDISVETDLQDEISSLGTIAGVRAPKVFSFVHDGKLRAITMERLNADTLRDIMSGKVDMPRDFDFDIFFDGLQLFIDSMNEAGYYHRDLHDGNIMVDRDTGMPYVIDFGLATKTSVPEDVYKRTVVRNGQFITNVLLSDTDGVLSARQKMQAYIINSKNRE